MSKKIANRILSLVVVLILALSLASCGSKPSTTDKSADSTAKKPVIALSNSYYGNTWRHQMVDSFEKAAKEAKEKGLISDYIIVNGDGTQQQQMTQMNDLILKKVDVIAIDSASPTALNGVIAKAQQAGIKVLSFDSIATEAEHYKLSFDFVNYGERVGNYAVDRFKGNANVLIIRGVAGSAPDNDMYQGMMNILNKNSGMKIVGTVYGQATTAVTTQQVSSILPSLPKVDIVLCQGGGDSYGVLQAYQQANMPLPVITGDGSAEFTNWLYKEYKDNGYSTFSIASTPGVGGAALWTAIDIANGKDVPKKMMMPHASFEMDEIEKYKDMQPNTIVSPDFSQDWVEQNLVNKK